MKLPQLYGEKMYSFDLRKVRSLSRSINKEKLKYSATLVVFLILKPSVF